MTDEQSRLILDILLALVPDSIDAVHGEWPNQRCSYCYGRNTGYVDSQSFEHTSECVTTKVAQLRATMQESEQ